MLALTVSDLACRRGMREIFSGIDFRLEEGNGLLLTGPNGSGKTTLLRMLAGFVEPAAGEVRLEGVEGEDGEEPEVGEMCHYVGHLNGIKHSFTVMENLRFTGEFFGGGDYKRAIEVFGLEGMEDIPAGLLSAGQKRRLGLSRLIVAPRPLWLLDEPSVSLDVASVKVLAGVVSDHVKKGGMVIAATHVPLGIDFTGELVLGQAGA